MKGSELVSILSWYGFTQREMAKRLNTTPQNFNSYLRAEDVRSSLIENIAKVLGISIGAMYGEGEDGGTPGQAAARAAAHGTAIAGNGNHLNTTSNEDKLLALLEEKDRQIRNYQDQVTKLIDALTSK